MVRAVSTVVAITPEEIYEIVKNERDEGVIADLRARITDPIFIKRYFELLLRDAYVTDYTTFRHAISVFPDVWHQIYTDSYYFHNIYNLVRFADHSDFLREYPDRAEDLTKFIKGTWYKHRNDLFELIAFILMADVEALKPFNEQYTETRVKYHDMYYDLNAKGWEALLYKRQFQALCDLDYDLANETYRELMEVGYVNVGKKHDFSHEMPTIYDLNPLPVWEYKPTDMTTVDIDPIDHPEVELPPLPGDGLESVHGTVEFTGGLVTGASEYERTQDGILEPVDLVYDDSFSTRVLTAKFASRADTSGSDATMALVRGIEVLRSNDQIAQVKATGIKAAQPKAAPWKAPPTASLGSSPQEIVPRPLKKTPKTQAQARAHNVGVRPSANTRAGIQGQSPQPSTTRPEGQPIATGPAALYAEGNPYAAANAAAVLKGTTYPEGNPYAAANAAAVLEGALDPQDMPIQTVMQLSDTQMVLMGQVPVLAKDYKKIRLLENAFGPLHVIPKLSETTTGIKVKNERVVGLSLSGKKMQQLPLVVCDLDRLTELWLVNTGLGALHPKITELTQLQYLFLGHNPFKVFPQLLFQLEYLKVLFMDHCDIQEIPDLSRMRQLETLGLGHNPRLTQLPDSMVQMDLKTLVLEGLALNAKSQVILKMLAGSRPNLRIIR
jgi:hypothetical protein